MTFYEWMLTRRETDTPSGDFLKDLKRDMRASGIENKKEQWEIHLIIGGACKQAKQAFQIWWRRYERDMKNV